MKAYATAGATVRSSWGSSVARSAAEPRWDLAFIGILTYLVIEYTRLPVMFPILQVLHLGKIAVAISALGLLLSPRFRGGKSSDARGIDIAMVVFLFASFFSACFARYQQVAWAGFQNTLMWALIYFLIARIVSNSWRLRVFVFLLLLLNLKLAQFAIRMYFAERASGLPESYLSKTGIGTGSTGFFANGEDLGLAMCVVWPMAGYLLFSEEKKVLRLLLLGSFVGFLLAIIFCGSRGALVGAGVAALAASVRSPKKMAAAAMILALLPAVLYVLPGANKERMRSGWDWENDQTASHRILLWKAGVRMFLDHPIIGVGPDNFALTRATYYADTDPHPTATEAHNTFVQAFTDLGLLGGGSFLMLLLFFLRLNSRTRKRLLASTTGGTRSFEYCLAACLDLALVGFLSSGFFHSSLYYPHLWLLLGLSGGLNTACLQKQLAPAMAMLQDQRRKLALTAS